MKRKQKTNSMKPITIKPAEVIREKSIFSKYSLAVINFLYALSRILLISLFFTGLSVIIGVYSFKIFKAMPSNIVELMDLVFKTPPPNLETILFVSISSFLISTIFFIEHVVKKRSQTESASNFIKTIVGCTIIIWIDIYTFRLDLQQLLFQGKNYTNLLVEVAFSQTISVLVIMLMTPLHKKMLSLSPFELDTPTFNEKAKKYLNYSKYYLIALLLIAITVYLATINSGYETYIFKDIEIPIIQTGSLLLVICFFVLFHYPEEKLGLSRTFTFLRFLLSIICGLGVGFLYGHFSNAEIYITSMLFALCLSVLSLFVAKLVS